MGVHKTVEIMAESDKGWSEAAQKVVEEASKTVKGIKSIWVKDQTARVKDGEIKSYRVNCKVTFEVKG
ncbi:MAG: dodecin family protein [Hyphomicrobiaceae bacterium]|nr:dodecin family protein [Hyphomicrobiaceae bacterium]